MSTISVVICAYTEIRWNQLELAVTSVEHQQPGIEVILVVDHNDVLLHRARHAWPQHRVMPNRSRKGLSGARNTGIDAATGDIVAFLDDDAFAEPDWIRTLTAPFVDPAVEGVGGRAVPVWPETGPSTVLAPELLWIVGCTYQGQPTVQADVRNVMGCAMAFRRDTLLELGGFDLDTGRVGRFPLGCEETDLCIRVRQRRPDARVVFEPAAVVHHHVSDDRLGWHYLRRRSFFEGVSKAALARRLGAGSALSTEAAYTTHVLPLAVLRELFSGKPSGVGRAAAIVTSLFAAAFGYAYGRAVKHTGAVSGGLLTHDDVIAA